MEIVWLTVQPTLFLDEVEEEHPVEEELGQLACLLREAANCRNVLDYPMVELCEGSKELSSDYFDIEGFIMTLLDSQRRWTERVGADRCHVEHGDPLRRCAEPFLGTYRDAAEDAPPLSAGIILYVQEVPMRLRAVRENEQRIRVVIHKPRDDR